MNADIYIGTSGWHYKDWIGTFYPPDVRGYEELTFHAQHFNTVENNSSFYRIASEATYKTWFRMTPAHYKFSLKLNRSITHISRLEVNEMVKERVHYVLTTTQVLEEKLGAIVIQLPPNFKYDLERLVQFLSFFTNEIKMHRYQPDVAIEFRSEQWFTDEVFQVLRTFNVALVTAQSSRYPEHRLVTANIAYIRLHGPKELFASSYSTIDLESWTAYIRSLSKDVERIYVYFNNDWHRYAIVNAQELKALLD